jgi:hypothetical protein
VENWRAFEPSAGGSGEPSGVSIPTPPGEPSGVFIPPHPTGSEERARTLSLIDFLADYDARRNPPVYDINKYGLFLLRDTDVPEASGVRLTPGEDAWLSVDFLDLPPRPEVPENLADLLGDSCALSPDVRPEVPEASGGPR